MTSDQHAVERAAYAVALKADISREFKCREHLNDYSTMLMVTHPDTPGWNAKVTILHRSLNRTQIELNDKFFAFSLSKKDALMQALRDLRKRHGDDMAEKREREKTEAEWMVRQTTELGALTHIPTVNFDIIRRGIHAGKYRVTLFPNHPLEHLTLEQVKAFHAFLMTLNDPVQT